MSQELTTTVQGELMERVLITGDLSRLQPAERVSYYRAVCDSIGLNPLTKPFDYITLNGKLVLYAKKDATEQLRQRKHVSIIKLERDKIDGVYIVTAYARTEDGREDSSTGAVNIDGLKGNDLANAIMKAETKAKRRVTLSICGLGFMDETEIETTPAVRVAVADTGEIVGNLGPQWPEGTKEQPAKPTADESAKSAKTGDGKNKTAVNKCPAFFEWCKTWIANHPEYADVSKTKPNMYHILSAVFKCGHGEVTENNMQDVISALEAHVRGKVDPQAQAAA